MNRTVFDLQEYSRAMQKTLLHMAVWTLLVAVAFAINGRVAAIPGFAVGATTSAVYFLLMAYRVRRSADLPPEQAVAHMRTGWAVRLAFVVMMLILSTRVSWIEFWPAVAGLFSLQAVILYNAVRLICNGGKS